MSKTAYNITLKDYVGGEDFDRKTVDRTLADNDGKQVNVLIDSLGGSLATGLSISAAFRNHGNVNVHFVGLNASATTIASLGAAHISIDAGAMYLVHKCSMALFSALQSAFGGGECHSLSQSAWLAKNHRVGAVFTFGSSFAERLRSKNEPPIPERNIIVFDDFVTTGATMISMKNLLEPLGYNLVFFTGINNKL